MYYITLRKLCLYALTIPNSILYNQWLCRIPIMFRYHIESLHFSLLLQFVFICYLDLDKRIATNKINEVPVIDCRRCTSLGKQRVYCYCASPLPNIFYSAFWNSLKIDIIQTIIKLLLAVTDMPDPDLNKTEWKIMSLLLGVEYHFMIGKKDKKYEKDITRILTTTGLK